MAKAIGFGVVFLIWFFLFLKVFADYKARRTYKNITKYIVRVAIFGAIASILYILPILKFPVPIFPSFLEFHFDEIPVFIAGFAYGPLTALGILVVKTIIKLPFTSTLTVGELSDLIYSAAFILPAAIIYKKNRKLKGALLGIAVGTALQLVVSLLMNIYVMVPFYMFMFNLSPEVLLFICKAANPKITNVQWGYGLYAVLPFNLIKDAIIIVVTLLVYKSTHKLIDKVQS